MDSQDLKSHQSNHRIILVFSEDAASADFKKQIANLKEASEACAERKLLLYQVLPNEVEMHNFEGSESQKWNSSSELYKDFILNKDRFKVVLIGLDGTMKEERQEPISSKELFDIIDSMPMRQARMNKGK